MSEQPISQSQSTRGGGSTENKREDAGHLEKRRARDEIGQIQSGALESNGQANLRIDLQRKLIEMLFTQSSPHLLLNMQESHPNPYS